MANTAYISAGLPVAKNDGQSPSSGVNTAYVSAGLPAEVETVNVIEGTTCWGHQTGVEEDNAYTFAGDWTGTGAVEGSGDNEYIYLDASEYMQMVDCVHTGEVTVTAQINKYVAGDTVDILYRHGASAAACAAAEWSAYSAPFASLGYVQLKLERT